MADNGESDSVDIFNTFQVLSGEYERIWPTKAKPGTIHDYRWLANANGQAALCLSGGGIRSAAFSLGLLQALSRRGLLTGFHYLSTVSGGGYMGAWLQRWIHEESQAADKVMVKLGAHEEPAEVKRLRENSNFITPRVGIGSNDTWTAVAISVRNILINWLLFVPLIMAVALLPNLFHDGVASIREAATLDSRFLTIPLGIAALAMACATFATIRLLPSYRAASTGSPGEGDRLLRRRIVWPLVIWAVAATHALAIELLGPPFEVVILPTLVAGQGIDVAVFSLGGMFAGLVAAAATLTGAQARTFATDWLIWPISFLVVTGWIALGSILFSALVSAKLDPDWGPILLTVLAPLWMLTGTLLGAIVFVAFRNSTGPAVLPDDDREWVARLSAVKIKPMLFWAILAPSVLLINGLPGVKGPSGQFSLSAVVTAIAGLVAVTGGRSQRSGATTQSAKRFILKYLPLNAIVGLATLVFIVALLMVFGLVENMLADGIIQLIASAAVRLPQGVDAAVLAHLIILVTLIGLLFYFGRKIPVNRFSLNGIYRNRLARAFLGAARPERAPDPFTGFDSADNVRLHLLNPSLEGSSILYPVINVALNVTATENLAWQERKAEPFVFTPLYSGSGMLSDPAQSAERSGAYVQTEIYAGGERDTAMGATTGVTLATAMSISGAAATPNMGYYSAPATAFLMTLFNVRLGAWLPNPARAAKLKKAGIGRSSPSNSIGAILRELRGATHDRGLDIYLSDGGHFENLALYEMIQRRCRYMVVSDVGLDPACTFKDLGNAVRKVKIDFDVDIAFPDLRISQRDVDYIPPPQRAWALGQVTYPETDLDGRRLKGDILYLKPSFFGPGLPVDVISYARGSKAFPHESAADQFFSESQFESYRRLAYHFLDELLVKMRVSMAASDDDSEPSMADFFAALKAEAAGSPAPKA